MKVAEIPRKVNSNVVRLVGGQVFLLSLIYIFTGWTLIPAFLVLDFAVRASGYPRYSLLAVGALTVNRTLKMGNRPIFFAPKRFAALIGLILSLSSVILALAAPGAASVLIIGVLGLFSFLESGFGFCAGCKIFGFLMHRGWIPSRFCADCAY